MGRVSVADISKKMNTNIKDLFTTEETRQNGESEKIRLININELNTFQNHPFKVLDDEKMSETVESIKEYGVLVPIIVRESKENTYEIIAGHRRTRACEILKIEKIPAIIRNLSDEESIIAMVDSNIQRENMLFSEKAFAYKMKLQAMKNQGKRTDLLEAIEKNEENKTSADLLGESVGESGRQIKRYIRLTNLVPELLELVDLKKIAFIAGVDLSYINEENQKNIFNIVSELNIFPSTKQGEKLKKYYLAGDLNPSLIENILKEKEIKEHNITLKQSKIKKYFPENYSNEKMEEVIIMLLEEWKGR